MMYLGSGYYRAAWLTGLSKGFFSMSFVYLCTAAITFWHYPKLIRAPWLQWGSNIHVWVLSKLGLNAIGMEQKSNNLLQIYVPFHIEQFSEYSCIFHNAAEKSKSRNALLKYTTEVPHWNIQLKYLTEMPHWNTQLKYPTKICHWNTPAEICHWNTQLKYPQWTTPLKYATEIPHWNTELTCCRRVPATLFAMTFESEGETVSIETGRCWLMSVDCSSQSFSRVLCLAEGCRPERSSHFFFLKDGWYVEDVDAADCNLAGNTAWNWRVWGEGVDWALVRSESSQSMSGRP